VLSEQDDWWAPAEVAEYLGITTKAWNSYVSRGLAPAAEKFFGRTPVWRPATVKEWESSRRGRGWRKGERKL
jgi:hypothetical protein